MGVMAAMHCHPFSRDHPGGKPKPETEGMRRQGTQVQRPMGLTAVQIDRYGGDCDVRGNQTDYYQLPPAYGKNPMVKPIQ
jgi:hypothetical protein